MLIELININIHLYSCCLCAAVIYLIITFAQYINTVHLTKEPVTNIIINQMRIMKYRMRIIKYLNTS